MEKMIKGIHHVAIHCRDIDRMIAFYRDALGFEVVGTPYDWADTPMVDQIIDVPGSAARAAMMRAGTCYIELFEFASPQPDSSKPLNPFDKGYTHFCLDVTDIEAEFERLKTFGMTFGSPVPVDVGHVKSVYGRDPEGNIIEIQETADACDFRMDKLPHFAH